MAEAGLSRPIAAWRNVARGIIVGWARCPERVVPMIRALALCSLVLLAAAPSGAWAASAGGEALETRAASADILFQRQDVREVSLPPPPSGPATPVPFCSPAQPICP